MLDLVIIAAVVAQMDIAPGRWTTLTVEVQAWAERGEPIVHQVGCVGLCMPDVGAQVRVVGGHAGDVILGHPEQVETFRPFPVFGWQTRFPGWTPEPYPTVEWFEYYLGEPNTVAVPPKPLTLLRFEAMVYGRPGETYRIEPIDPLVSWPGRAAFVGEFDIEFQSVEVRVAECYADCDTTTGAGVLDLFDFLCFGQRFAAGDMWADCDGSLTLDALDWLCFEAEFAWGCE